MIGSNLNAKSATAVAKYISCDKTNADRNPEHFQHDIKENT